jgi:hypothetical protein
MNRLGASLLVGLAGATVGAFFGELSSFSDSISISQEVEKYSVSAGAGSGLLICLILSILYLKFMKGRSYLSGLGFGPLFGAAAGGLSGLITGIISEIGFATSFNEPFEVSYLRGFELFVEGGAIIGAVIGFILSILFGWAFYTKEKTSEQDTLK